MPVLSDDVKNEEGPVTVHGVFGDPFVPISNAERHMYESEPTIFDDVIDGDALLRGLSGSFGTDSLVFSGPRDAYEVYASGDLIYIDRPAGTEVPIRNFEYLDFSDGSYVFGLQGDQLDFTYRVYSAALGRVPDEPGLRYWNAEIEAGLNQKALAESFVASREFKSLLSANPSDEQLIEAPYGNVLGRAPDQGGYTFWLDVFSSGRVDRPDMLVQFAESPENIDHNVENLELGIWVA